MDTGILFTKVLALFTLGGNVFAFLFLMSFFVARGVYDNAMQRIGKLALPIGFFLATTSTAGSIIYSEVVGFPACILCWISRIFMYPLMPLLLLALWRKDRGIYPYAMLLTVLGVGVSVYHWSKDMLALYSDVSLPCPAVSALPSCDKIYVLEFGYITIPMIALNAFILIGIVMYAGMRAGKQDEQ